MNKEKIIEYYNNEIKAKKEIMKQLNKEIYLIITIIRNSE